MFKKLLFIALLGAIGVYAFQHHFKGRCCFDLKRKDQPLEAKIKRERGRLPELDAEIRKLIGQVAAREVELKNLEKDLAQTEKSLEQSRTAMQVKEEELKLSATLVKEAGNERQRNLRDLNRLADTVERLDAALQARKDQREAFKEALHSAHEELVAYKNERLALETELARLDALVAQMRADETKSRVHFDKSKLAEATKRIENLRMSAEVRQKERELSVKYLGDPHQPQQPVMSEKDVLERVKKLSVNKNNSK